MRKMKGVAVIDDHRTRFRHETLMQDYEDLQKEAEALRKKLQMMKQKRFTLMAEVRFLRRRYKYLTQNQVSTSLPETKLGRSRDLKIGSKSNAKRKKQSREEEAGLPPPVPRFNLNKKSKDHISDRIVDLNHKQRLGKENEGLRNFLPLPDLNQAETSSSSRGGVPVFDLNQISKEEEELQAHDRQMEVEDSKNNSLRNGNDELQNNAKLSVCRTIKNGLNRAGKRKVSWQDPVALSV